MRLNFKITVIAVLLAAIFIWPVALGWKAWVRVNQSKHLVLVDQNATQLIDAIRGGTSAGEIQKMIKANPQSAMHIRSSGETLLDIAVGCQRYDLVPIFVDDRFDVNDRIMGDWYGHGETPLITALGMNDEKMVAILLDCKADVNIADEKGKTPLYWAILQQNERIVNMLEKKGAK